MAWEPPVNAVAVSSESVVAGERTGGRERASKRTLSSQTP